jgi:tetratricopeptide (TPR) repeat protein
LKQDACPVAEFRYKAFISYSHQDEAWARWLHGALESYRIPRRLVGKPGRSGAIPARINPVFRDREDLSAARDLSKRITEALSHSESLIIICSPGAAQSRWVNEEIRKFRTTSQGDRIFCLIVDGDPQPEPAEKCCFPPAMFESFEQQGFEPLAADARKWADGKRLAKLKLIAGLLGIPLDELRQRDLQRRRKLMAVAGLGMAAVLALVAMTLVSQVSRQHQRDIAEQMASFIVDLGEKLQSETDLDTLALISSEAYRHFQNLDPDKLTAETGKRVALTLRQVGRVSQLQGKPEEAIKAFLQSRDLFSRLSYQSPESSSLLFELGNAEFYLGNFHLEQGDYAHARIAFENNHEITGALLKIDPENPDWMMERSYTHNNLAAVQLKSGMGVDDATLAHMQAAIVLIEKVMQQVPDKTSYASHYATTLAWAADAQYQACNLENAMALRQKARQLAESLARLHPGDNDLKRRYAYAISGVATIQTNSGLLDLAEQNLRLSISMLEQMSAADPSNILYPQQIAYRQILLAKLMIGTGRLEEARALLVELDLTIGADSAVAEKNEEARHYSIDFQLETARINYLMGNRREANLRLHKALQLQLSASGVDGQDNLEREKIQEMRFQWWEVNGEEGLAQFPVVIEPGPAVTDALRSCEDALISAKEFVIEGELDKAVLPVKYLQERGYADPAFIQFCTKYSLCPGESVKS